MKIHFNDHSEHRRFLDSGTSITDALDENDVSVNDLTCAGCFDNDEQIDDDNRSAYHMVNGQIEVREKT